MHFCPSLLYAPPRPAMASPAPPSAESTTRDRLRGHPRTAFFANAFTHRDSVPLQYSCVVCAVNSACCELRSASCGYVYIDYSYGVYAARED